jgi:hypothetical protein
MIEIGQGEMELIMLGLKNPKEKNIKRKRCMCYPNDTKKTWWDIFISLVLLFSCFTTPLDLAFPNL